jgi:hypothetical protein
MRLAILLLACSGGEVDTGDAPLGACGTPSQHDLSVRVAVQSEDGALLEDIEVVLDDRAWNPGPLGSAITDVEGEGELDASGVTDLPGCWGTMLDYVLVATDPRGEWATGEKDVNSSLYNAISDGSMVADVRAFPLVLDAMGAE